MLFLAGCIVNCPDCDRGAGETAESREASEPPSSCLAILDAAPGTPSGLQTVTLSGEETVVWCDMERQGGGWMQVGRVEGTGDWIRRDDHLEGTSPFNEPDPVNPLEGNSFFFAFEAVGDVLFAAGDGSAWGVIDLEAAIEATDEAQQANTLVRASHGTRMTAAERTNVLLRRGSPEDPWIGFNGGHYDNATQMFYGEDAAPEHTAFKNEHGGINIFVRPSCAGHGTRVFDEACTCEDGHTGIMCDDVPADDTEDTGGLTPAVASWTLDGDDDSALLGKSAVAADVDGDGFDDVVVGEPGIDSGHTNEGRALLFAGSAEGLGAVPAWSVEPDWFDASLGYSVAAGDLDGDGFADIVLSEHYYDDDVEERGGAVVYSGSASGLPTTPSFTLRGDRTSQFGLSLAVGDLDGDGFSDLIAGAPVWADGEEKEGAAFVYPGSADGLTDTPTWSIQSGQEGAHLGVPVACAGDVDGDALDDVLVAAPDYDDPAGDEGRVWLYLGAPDGLSDTPSWTLRNEQAAARLGTALASAGDVDADGYDDVLIGAAAYDGAVTDNGAWLYLGSATGLEETAAWSGTSLQDSAFFGLSLSAAGDLDADGFGDVIVGAPGFDDGEANEGAVFVFFGSPSGLDAEPGWYAASDAIEASLGWWVASAGDVNGDACADLLAGAPGYDGAGLDRGRMDLFLGE